MLRKFMALVLVLCFAHMVSAFTYNWDGGGGDNYWGTAANWDPDVTTALGAPGAADWVRFYKGAGAPDTTTIIREDQSIEKLQFRFPQVNVALTVTNDATLTVSSAIELENNLAGKTSTITIDPGATINVGISMKVGRASRPGDSYMYVNGTLNVTNGSTAELGIGNWSAGYYAGSGAHLYIGATGVVSVDSFEMNVDGLDVDALIDITTGGVMYVAGDVTTVFKDYRALGLILGDNTVGNVKATFDGTDTTIEVPEPMTIALLGLGGLLLRKRR